ncbi:MAG: helix-turn-helix domain-containing protein [Saccharofermentans sp.]|nr:helix-turn-helix domain-containing protein [Saccharofermentans sp.]
MEEIKKCIRVAAPILKAEAGVMDTNGLIIASTNPDMEGQTDSASRAVMVSEDQFSSTSDKTYMKISLTDQVRYIAYLNGTDAESRTNLSLLGEWIRSVVKEHGSDAEKELFTKNVLLENELQGDIPIKARDFKINCNDPRLVIVVRTSEEQGANTLDILQSIYGESSDSTVIAMDESTSIIVLNVSEVGEAEADRSTYVDEISEAILDSLNNEGITAYIGVGSFVPLFQQIAKSYRDAMLALRVGKIFEKNCYISKYNQLGLGRLIYQLPSTLCRMFIDEVFPNEAYKSLDEDTIETIDCFFKNNLNGSETSRELFVHRNTLVYRLDKVKKNTGLDLRSFDDAVLFKMASMVRTYLQYLETSKDNMIR